MGRFRARLAIAFLACVLVGAGCGASGGAPAAKVSTSHTVAGGQAKCPSDQVQDLTFTGSFVGAAYVGPAGVFAAAWSKSVTADIVFVVGSLASAGAGLLLTRRSKPRSIGLALLMTWITYTIAASLITGPVGMPGEGDPPEPGAPDPVRTTLVLAAPLLGLFGLIFAAVAPALAADRLARIFPTGQARRQSG
jgi:hypothetical protein